MKNSSQTISIKQEPRTSVNFSSDSSRRRITRDRRLPTSFIRIPCYRLVCSIRFHPCRIWCLNSNNHILEKDILLKAFLRHSLSQLSIFQASRLNILRPSKSLKCLPPCNNQFNSRFHRFFPISNNNLFKGWDHRLRCLLWLRLLWINCRCPSSNSNNLLLSCNTKCLLISRTNFTTSLTMKFLKWILMKANQYLLANWSKISKDAKHWWWHSCKILILRRPLLTKHKLPK